MKIVDNEKFKLCYIEDNFAWFTTAKLDEQWGDDWSDIPYEHSAGSPYEWQEGDAKAEYKLMKIAFYSSDLETPAEIAGHNSCYSVQAINGGAVSWLSNRWSKPIIAIHAGISPEEFIKAVKESGGDIFIQV